MTRRTTLRFRACSARQYQIALVLLIPLVLIAASGGGYWLSRRALAPVDRIISDAQEIGSRSLERRLVMPQTGDELQRLSQTLNQMLERLDQALRRVTQFTADASHELRTPVAVIRTTTELALRRSRPPAEYEAALRDILTQSEKTTELIESLVVTPVLPGDSLLFAAGTFAALGSLNVFYL